MIIIAEKEPKQNIQEIVKYIESKGLTAFISEGEKKTVVGAIGNERELDQQKLEMMKGVLRVVPVLAPYQFASREFKPKNTVINVNGVKIGSDELTIMAGPCAVESEEQLREAAQAVKQNGAQILRGSAFKPRTSPYQFQGLKEKGLKMLRKVADELKMPVETEIMDIRNVKTAAEHVDLLRIGARNMQNYDLLKEVGKTNKPVILKNGLAATIKEFILAAEYILAEGNQQVIFCERGLRTAETETRFTLDLSAIPVLKKLTHLPVIADPSHSSGKRYLVPPMSKAAIASGADGLIIEVHPQPEKALCDGPQSLTPKEFKTLMTELKPLANAVGRKL
ncbi:MAG: 3-deoxy-7-phosphoheptulonate synthase [Candidatus Micrarchaeia archaeon]